MWIEEKNKRQIWQEWEDLVLEYYEKNGYEILDTNYTIPWWEIDIIAQKNWEIAFVEVKVVDGMDDIAWYITPKKIMFLERTIQDYMYKKWLNFQIRMDVVFLKNNEILEVYENVTNN
jgi:putative endonuclease